jgi:hypothetical protein
MGDYQTILNWVLGVAMGVSGWFARQMWDAVTELKKDLATLREELAKDYVPKNDFREFASEIRQMFQRISDKLDEKADK